MNSLTSKLPKTFGFVHLITLVLGLLMLVGSWFVVYLMEHLFAESHFASYYCCLMPEELAAIDPAERAVSDFFRTSPGRDLPGLLFIAANVALLARAWRRTSPRALLPLKFALLNGLYVAAEMALVVAAQNISTWLLGPQTTPYRGYDRNAIGIVLHLALWAVYVGVLWRAGRQVSAAPAGPS